MSVCDGAVWRGGAGWTGQEAGPEQLHRDLKRGAVPLRLQAAELREEGVDAPVQQIVVPVEVGDCRFELVDLPCTGGAVSMPSDALDTTAQTVLDAASVATFCSTLLMASRSAVRADASAMHRLLVSRRRNVDPFDAQTTVALGSRSHVGI